MADSQSENDQSAEALSELVTLQRLSSYLESTSTLASAMRLYEWNIDACAAVLSTVALVEVAVRNSIDRVLTTWAVDRGYTTWLDHIPVDDRARRDIEQAKYRAQRRDRGHSQGDVISELNFGFWRYLVTGRYLTSLWLPSLQHAFPYGSPDPVERLRQVERNLDTLVFVRNRAAHHEPIHRRKLMSDFNAAVKLMACVHPTAEAWVKRRSTIPIVLRARPSE